MKRVGLVFLLVLLCIPLLLAVPKPIGRLDRIKSVPLKISAMTFYDAKLYVMLDRYNELMYHDLNQGTWHPTGIKVSSKADISSMYIRDDLVYLLDSRKNTITIYDLDGTQLSQITTKGVKELKFKNPSHLLVNYQGYIYVLDSRRLYAFSKEGMLICSTKLDNPASMSLGDDQLIRVLLHKKSGSEIRVYDQLLTKISSTKIPNPTKKTNHIIDMAINSWGELHVINDIPLCIEKLNAKGMVIPDTRFGSFNKARVEGAFESPVMIKCTPYGESSLIAIYDDHQASIQLFQDTEVLLVNRLQPPPYTKRFSLEDSSLPAAYDIFPCQDRIYSISNLIIPKIYSKPGPALHCTDESGNTIWVRALREFPDKNMKSLTALAVHDSLLYVVDEISCTVHIFSAMDGQYIGNFASKGSLNGDLKSPSSIVVAEDGRIYVADRLNYRISVFSQHRTFTDNITLLNKKQSPVLLRLKGNDLYCLTDDSTILQIPLNDPKMIKKVASRKKISSFDLLDDSRIAFVDGNEQKLNIYKDKIREHYLFSKSKKANFPHFADIFLVRYDPWRMRLAIMDSKVKSLRFLHFYPALDNRLRISMSLDDSLKVKLAWDASPGVKSWLLEAVADAEEKQYILNQTYYTVNESQPSMIRYRVCPIAEDDKKGLLSAPVEDYFSYGRFLYENGIYIEAANAFKKAQSTLTDPRVNTEIVNCYISESDRYYKEQDYLQALQVLKNASSVTETDTTIALKTTKVYKALHDYLGGIKYLESINYKDDSKLCKEYIELNYMAKEYGKVVFEAKLYKQIYGFDESVSRFHAAVCEDAGDIEEALAIYQEIVSHNDSFDDKLKLARLRYSLEQYDVAESELQHLLTKYPNRSEDTIRNLLGLIKLKRHNYGLAIDHFSAAIQINDKIAEYHYGLGIAYQGDNNHLEAQKSLQKAHQLSPENTIYAFEYARTLERQNRFEDALSVMESVADYVYDDLTATDFYVLHANLLWQVGNLSDALKEITKAKRYRPDDFEIDRMFQDIQAEIQVQNLERDVIEITKVDLRPVYPSLDEYYKLNPIGTITLHNARKTTVSDIEVTVYIHEVSNRIKVFNVPSVVPGQDKIVDITMDFNERLFDRPRKVAVEISLNFEYEGLNYNPTLPPQYLQILDSKAMNWENRRSLASFVNPKDINLSYFVRENIVQTFKNEQSTIIIPNLIKALQAYSFYRANGIRFISDSSMANLDSSTQDEVQFPHQLLQSKSGDCEDLLVLMAGTLESIGIPTAFIDIPNHVILAIRTNMDSYGIESNGLDLEYFIEHKGSYLLPLETTLLGKADFVTSWLTAVNSYQEMVDSGILPEIIEFSEAHNLYPPSSFSKAIDSSKYTNYSDAREYYNQDLLKISNISQINLEMDYQAALKKHPDNISVSIQYALFCVQNGKLEKAEQLLQSVLYKDPSNFSALMNLGNVYAKSKKYDLATRQYKLALSFADGMEDQVYRNLCIMEYRNSNLAQAIEYFKNIIDKNIIRDANMEIYFALMNAEDTHE